MRSARTRRAPALVTSPRNGRAAAGSRLLRLLGLVTPPATSLSIFAGIALPVGALAPLDGLLWWSILRLTYRPAVKMVRTRVKARTNMSSWMWYPVSRAVWCEHRAECCTGFRNASGSPDSWSLAVYLGRRADCPTSAPRPCGGTDGAPRRDVSIGDAALRPSRSFPRASVCTASARVPRLEADAGGARHRRCVHVGGAPQGFGHRRSDGGGEDEPQPPDGVGAERGDHQRG